MERDLEVQAEGVKLAEGRYQLLLWPGGDGGTKAVPVSRIDDGGSWRWIQESVGIVTSAGHCTD